MDKCLEEKDTSEREEGGQKETTDHKSSACEEWCFPQSTKTERMKCKHSLRKNNN